MFRDCIRHEPVARLVLESHLFPDMYAKLELGNFEVASGARWAWEQGRAAAGCERRRRGGRDAA